MDESRTGERNNFYGKHHSPETLARLSALAKQRKATAETRESIRLGHLGDKNHMFGKHHSEEAKQKISVAKRGQPSPRKGTKHSSESIAKMSAVKLGNGYSVGHSVSEEAKQRMSADRMGKPLSAETKHKMSEALLLRWQDPEYRDYTVWKSHSAQNKRPNSCEIIVGNILNEVAPGEWLYVGDCKQKFVILGKNPDFVNVNGQKKLIEHFGIYWHGKRARKYEETEEGRKALFAKLGFSTLIIWEPELKDRQKLTEKIREFCKKE